MQRITNNISANLTSTQATEKAMYNMGKLGFILSLFSILKCILFNTLYIVGNNDSIQLGTLLKCFFYN